MRRVLITGAGRGLGLEFVRQCLARGDLVFAGVRHPEQATALRELAAAHSDRLLPLALEVTGDAAIAAARDMVAARVDGLDLLINNAGINSMSAGAGEPAAHLRLGQLQAAPMLAMFHTNAVAPLLVAQACLDLLRAGRDPRVVSISSWLGSLAGKTSGGNYSYCASKTALNMLLRAFAFDVLPFGILSVVVNPGWVQTDMGGARAQLTPEESVAGILRVVAALSPAQAGGFYDWNGVPHPW